LPTNAFLTTTSLVLAIAAAGGVKAVLAAMSAHTADAAVQQQGSGALCNNLAVNAKNQVAIAGVKARRG
jgi:hypothetical protein